MMPIMTGGIAVIPPSLVSHAGAFNNVVQRTTAALGLAVLTAMVTSQQAQQIEDRTALIPMGTPMPQVAGQADGGLGGMMQVYQHTQNQVFVSALNDMYIVTALITAAGVVLALMLHSGPAPAQSEDPTPVARAAPVEPGVQLSPADDHTTKGSTNIDGSGSNGSSHHDNGIAHSSTPSPIRADSESMS
jgi:hypothetical protein